jgi:hypothetical protein
MSLICLLAFIMELTGDSTGLFTNDNIFIIWALFSIADAIWVGRCKQ